METRKWYAWINLMPPKPDDFHVSGEIFVGNPGVQGVLHIKEPQGINPNVIMLEMRLNQQPGMWPQVMTWVQVRYDSVVPPSIPHYAEVEIYFDEELVTKTSVDIVH